MFRKTPLHWQAELRATLRLAAPLAGANLLQMAVYGVDVIFIARLGQEALSASSLAVSLFGLLMWSMTGLVGAAAPLISNELGSRRHAVRQIRRTLRMAIWLAFLAGLLVMAICFAGEPLMLLTGQQTGVAALAGPFLAVLAFAAIPGIFAGLMRVFVSALGRPGLPSGLPPSRSC